MIYLLVVLVVFAYLFISGDSARAAIPNSARIIPFQGVLTNSSGNYVVDGNYDMVFSIYNVASAGTALWSTTHSGANAVAVTNGSFSVNIGSLDANGVNIAMDTPPYYLGIKVGTNAEMTPRIQLGFSPFAMTSKNLSNVYTDASGNVGIGTTGPGEKLVIKGSANSSTDEDILTITNGASAGAWNVDVHRGIIWRGGEGGNDIKARIAADPDAAGDWNLDFYTTTDGGTNVVRQMRITDDGNVGIGTTSFGANGLLQVAGDIGLAGTRTIRSASNSDSDSLRFLGTQLAVGQNNSFAYGYSGGGLIASKSNSAGAILLDVGSYSGTNNLKVTNDGTGLTGSMTYMGGNVGIGTTSPQGKLDVAGTAYVTSGAWSGSDIRWKKNIVPLRDSLSKVLQLQGVSFLWNKEAYPDKGFTEGPQVGLIAQNVEKVIPEIVSTNSEGYKSLSYEKLTAVLIEAIKELKAENELLRSRVSVLETRQY